MTPSFAVDLEKRESGDLLILPYWEGPSEAADLGSCRKIVLPAVESGDFKGKNGEGVLLYPSEGKEGRILLLGLGKEAKASAETVRRAYSNAIKTAFSKKAKRLNVLLPRSQLFSRQDLLRGVFEGVLLTNYSFSQLKGVTLKEAPPLIEKMGWIGLEKQEIEWLKKAETLAHGVYFARDLVNGNADDVTPRMLADTAVSLQKRFSTIATTLYDKKWLQQQKMGLILAVSRGSKEDPLLIQMAYRGNPESKEEVVLVGKGVTYDTGGLALKTPEGMLSMKADMAGAAAVLGAIQTAAALNLKVNVTGLIPTVENSIGAESYKMGDVYRSYSGKTVEVNNTDAEGRLILADAMAYAVQVLKPSCLIDLATLTGNIILALGEEYAGLFSSDDLLSKELLAASEQTGELLWRMPLHEEYKEAVKSDIADLINSGGREAGAIKAALFLKEFAGETPWVHLDVAGPTFWNKPRYYHPTKATGFGVRLLVEFLEKRGAK